MKYIYRLYLQEYTKTGNTTYLAALCWERSHEQTTTGDNYRYVLVDDEKGLEWSFRKDILGDEYSHKTHKNITPTTRLLNMLYHKRDRLQLTKAALRGHQPAQEFLRLVQDLKS